MPWHDGCPGHWCYSCASCHWFPWTNLPLISCNQLGHCHNALLPHFTIRKPSLPYRIMFVSMLIFSFSQGLYGHHSHISVPMLHTLFSLRNWSKCTNTSIIPTSTICLMSLVCEQYQRFSVSVALLHSEHIVF